MRRFFLVALGLLFFTVFGAGVTLLLFGSEVLASIDDEQHWRQKMARPSVTSLNDYVHNCSSCAHSPEAWSLIDSAQRQTGLVSALDLDEQVRHASLTADGETLVTAGSSHISIWESTTAARKHQLWMRDYTKTPNEREELGHSPQLVTVMPDGHTLVSASDTGVLWFWNLATQQRLQTIKVADQGLDRLSVSPDGQRLAWVHEAEEARSLEDQRIVDFPHPEVMRIGLVAPNEIVTISRQRILWWYPDGRATGLSHDIASYGFPLDLSADGGQVFFQGGTYLEVWGTRMGQKLHSLEHEEEVTAVCTSEAKSYLLTGTRSGKVYLWEDDKLLASFRAHPYHVDFLGCAEKSGRFVSINQHSSEVKVWSREALVAGADDLLIAQAASAPLEQTWYRRMVQWGADVDFPKRVPALTRILETDSFVLMRWQILSIVALLVSFRVWWWGFRKR